MAAYKVDPESKPVKAELKRLKVAVEQAKAKERAAFGGVFAKAAKAKGGLYGDEPDNVVVHSGDLPRVYFDLEEGGKPIGRVVFRLFADTVGRCAHTWALAVLLHTDTRRQVLPPTLDARQVFNGPLSKIHQ